MEGGQSAKYFYARWDSNDYSCGCEVCSCIYIHPHGKHMVGSDDEAKESDGHHCSHYSHVSERFFFTRVVGDDVGDYAEPWQDENIYFRVSEESEQMLV